MKIVVTLKDPDGFSECVDEVVDRSFGNINELDRDEACALREVRQRLCDAIEKRRQRSKLLLIELSRSRTLRCLNSITFHAGSNNPMSILNEDDVLVIREWAEAGVMYADLAEHFGVRWGTIKAIVRRETWRHL